MSTSAEAGAADDSLKASFGSFSVITVSVSEQSSF